MQIKQLIAEMLPSSLETSIRIRRHTKRLMSVPRVQCDARKLRSMRETNPQEMLRSPDAQRLWQKVRDRIAAFAIPDGTGGVNPGERQAIFYLICALDPKSVLEVGTHIGASTVNISSALAAMQEQTRKPVRLVSVDISDVNAPQTKPWLQHGGAKSPREMVRELGHEGFVEFVVDSSLDYLQKSSDRFDFIFLDGDHAADTVYKEIPAALRVLNENGVILLHDYFPDMKPIWSAGQIIPGPFLATRRLATEGADLVVVPFGSLPWPTKLESNASNLALVLRASR